MRRDFFLAAALWVILTVLAEWVVTTMPFFPVQAAKEAAVIDEAFRRLFVLGAPVFTFVVAGLVYSVLRFRASGDPPGEGPPIHTHPLVTWGWLAVTSGLAVWVIFNPGLKGLAELSADREADLVVQVTARKWEWDFTYPQYGVSLQATQELVLPVGRRVRFEVTSDDIIHSFWIPAFRMKADAVPGLTQVLYVTPDRTGTFEDDFNLRVQCAELCGTGHPRMRTRLRIVPEDEFEAWLEQAGASAGG